jgi:pimeloyl-ACP methyl ester carboxylesterase
VTAAQPAVTTSGREIPFQPPSGFARGDVDTGGIRLHFWRRGRGQPLLVLHGITDWGLDWARFARKVDDVFDCILLDQRGHGYSDKPAEGYGYQDLAADAWGVIERLGLQRPAVLGHSLGGGVALHLAASHPQAIDRLVLVDPALRLLAPGEAPRPAPQPTAARNAGLKARQARGRRALIEELRATRPTFDPEDVSHTVESTLLASPFVWSGRVGEADPDAQAALLRRLTCPTLVVRGESERGAIISTAAARLIEDLVPEGRARVTTIAGTGHIPQREAFALFVAVVRPFLTGTASPPAAGGTPPCFAHLISPA